MKLITICICCSVFVIFTSSDLTEARMEKIRHNKKHENKNSWNINPSLFNVLAFGAKADGISDDSKALLAAWKSACNVSGAVLLIPSEFKFLIKPVTLQGPCMPNLVLQIDGILLAPVNVGTWLKYSLYQWINFKWLHSFTIQGSGTADGQGYNWWDSSLHKTQKKKVKKIPGIKPTALRFYASYNITVRDISIKNSPLCHLKFDNSKGVKVNNITILSPGNSPNTDGIHLQNSQDVEIQHSSIGSGDDCVSIQTGCSNVHVHHVYCSPGHGISLGGLGKGKSLACVSNIVVENITMLNTLYGARIKTWQGGLGSVRNVSFSNIQVTEVKYPIMIDQYYCDKNQHACKNQTEAVAISGVEFNQITGTYATQPIHLACSISFPCIDVVLDSIQLQPSKTYGAFQQPMCSNSYGRSTGLLVPQSMDYCVGSGSDSIRRISKSHDVGC